MNFTRNITRIKSAWPRMLQLYISSLIIYYIGLLIIRNVSHYQNMLSVATQNTFVWFFMIYLIISPLYYISFTIKDSVNKPFILIRAILRIFTTRKFFKQKSERTAFLFMVVKIFFLPMMINFFFSNAGHLLYLKDNFSWYPFIFTFMFTLDTLIFSFGYSFEFKSLKNVVKSVEPTLFGWAVAVACYPPFNWWVGNYVPWGANDYATFWSPTWTLALRIIIVVLLSIYVVASLSLGAKASNLTNRGIVTKFPYSVVRHPAYISKNLIWWLTLLPVMSWAFFWGMTVWSVIYFFRAVTEERHLRKDPDYREYCKRVRYRFIPGIY
ncbi:hypothetical protein HN385_04820 [archaeon]|jgi:protein-S-isoprenylcysteine O-methyltransferase Ste14|nr:hypothetical protein [archaeon]MBT3451039.1 hypothetical protein [archaeon]MBT6869129.1 hypothetical protein [archaeon]MBT7192776.1 hypothetical protein [archaeon]MBT7381316.1 hypothetical protein [archaeon]